METINYKKHVIKLEQFSDAENPIKNWDGNCKYALFHKRYDVVNDTDLDTSDYGGWDEFKEALIEKHNPLAILPVYMYDHSGQTISTEPFGGLYGRFDSGQLGFVFVDSETLNEWGFDSKEAYEESTKRTLEDDIKANVQLYDDYITGNVWGFEVVDSDEDHVDSCWGFYGDSGKEEALKEAKSVIDNQVPDGVIETNYKQQYAVLEEMQSAGFNVCTCGNCGGVILYNKKMKEAESVSCPHCKHEMDYSDNPDFYYEGCSEVHNEENQIK